MSFLRRRIHKVTIWHVRFAVLGLLVIFVGGGAQVLVNAVAADPGLLNVKVGAYARQGPMADGSWTHPGACAVDKTQFPFGTIIALYNTTGTLNRECIAEDTDRTVGYNSIELAMPGDSLAVQHWGARNLLAQIVRWGWGSQTPPKPATMPPSPALLPPIWQPARHSHAS